MPFRPDFFVFSPVFDTPSKRGILAPSGVTGLGQALGLCGTVPVVALGGVGPENVAACFRAGAHGIAAIRAFDDLQSVDQMIRALKAMDNFR